MHDDQILDGSDDTTAGSTQTQRRTALKETMNAALLILNGLNRSSINDLAKDQDYRDLVHRFLSPLTSRPLHDAIDQANRVLKNGLDDISRGMAGLFPVDNIPSVNSVSSAPSQTPIPPSDLLPSRSHPAATTKTSLEPSLSPGISLALRQRQEPRNSAPMRPLEQIKNDKRKMVTIHFIVGSIHQQGISLQNIIEAVNKAIREKTSKKEQRVLEAWMTQKEDIVLACQSPLDDWDGWTEDLPLHLSHLWANDTVIHARRGTTTAYVARLVDIATDKLTLSVETLRLRLGGNAQLVAQMKAHFKRRWGDVEFGIKLGPGIYLCSGSADVLNAFASASPEDISLVVPHLSGIREVYGTTIIGLRLSDDQEIAY